jgi:hypothetical protein
MTSFKLATCTVTLDGHGDPKGTAQRISMLSNAAFKLSQSRIELFSLPAGYLFASNVSDRNALKKQVQRLAIAAGIDLLVGMDETVEDSHPGKKRIGLGRLPALAIFASRDGRVVTWRQRTTNSEDQYRVSDAVCQKERLIRVAPRVESLICGEIFNERIRGGLVDRKTALVIDQAHTAAGFRVFAAMKVLASSGMSSLCSVHAGVRGAVKHCYVPGKPGWRKKSSRASDLDIGKEPRLEIKVWGFDLTGRIVPSI